MNDEFEPRHAKEVWDLVTLSNGCKVINSTWIFKCKVGED